MLDIAFQIIKLKTKTIEPKIIDFKVRAWFEVISFFETEGLVTKTPSRPI